MIQTQNLSKTFDRISALSDVHLTVAPGTILGLAGKNGCGKTTLLNILATILKPTSGSVEIAGIDALKSPFKIRPRIGYISELLESYDHLIVGELIEFIASCKNLKSIEMGSSGLAKEFLGQLKTESLIGSISRGEKQRLAWISALAHAPVLLLLDDPMSHLDPEARARCREELLRFRSRGGTALIACNRTEDINDLCDSVAVLHEGRLLKVIKVGENTELPELFQLPISADRHSGISPNAEPIIQGLEGKRS
jgi:ABC-2 type transport system ATP-binding protein